MGCCESQGMRRPRVKQENKILKKDKAKEVLKSGYGSIVNLCEQQIGYCIVRQDNPESGNDFDPVHQKKQVNKIKAEQSELIKSNITKKEGDKLYIWVQREQKPIFLAYGHHYGGQDVKNYVITRDLKIMNQISKDICPNQCGSSEVLQKFKKAFQCSYCKKQILDDGYFCTAEECSMGCCPTCFDRVSYTSV